MANEDIDNLMKARDKLIERRRFIVENLATQELKSDFESYMAELAPCQQAIKAIDEALEDESRQLGPSPEPGQRDNARNCGEKG